MLEDVFNSKKVLQTRSAKFTIYSLRELERQGLTHIDRLPYSMRIMLESVLRQCNNREITRQDVLNLAGWQPAGARPGMPFMPGRVLMQDFTGVPAIVDLAAMRSAVARLSGDARRINPLIPVDLVIDHSVQVDYYGNPEALKRNIDMEFERNCERYEFLNWGQKAFDNFRVIPPAMGICHQVNLEYLAQVILSRTVAGETLAFPDTLVGTDSHTTMINGLGVVGWGVGGIEAEAAMLGQPMDMLIPDVVGFKITGKLSEGVTATDLVLTVTQMLRKKGVVGKFVEFYGAGLAALSLPDRATIGNMAPEYGATIGFFPVDDETLHYLRFTGRSEETLALVEAYCKEQGLFWDHQNPDPQYSDTLELELGNVEPSLAGPKRPQDRVSLKDVKSSFQTALKAPVKERGFELDQAGLEHKATVKMNGQSEEIRHGAVVLAAITSCTNTSNPMVMVQAGLLAQKAVGRGLKSKPYVKTSLAPGSRVVTDYLQQAGLMAPLAELGFDVVGYGCTSCIGNSGPLPDEVAQAIKKEDLVTASVLSGNRNFEGRVHALVRANYLASPPLVVAYAIAGRMDIDLYNEPLGKDRDGKAVYLKEIWPSNLETEEIVAKNVSAAMFTEQYAHVFQGSEAWQAIQNPGGDVYEWSSTSTYIQEPPFFADLELKIDSLEDIRSARVLAWLGDSITTDHISPAGAIQQDGPAGRYLQEHGVTVRDFNSYGARRGNDRIMVRGTFANIRLKNRMTPGIEGGVTLHLPDKKQMSIYEAALLYKQEGLPLIILAGKEYGSGSSRDWAAKGTLLLGVKAVIAESYERIHRSNLVGMGVLPLQFRDGESADTLGLNGSEVFDILGLNDNLQPNHLLSIQATNAQGKVSRFEAIARLDTAIEVNYYRNGGILQTVLRNLLKP